MANQPTEINFDDGSLKPYSADNYADLRGVVDYGNLLQFAPYESGYSALAVINSPYFMRHGNQIKGVKDLNTAFVRLLEKEFKGLDGIENITSENMTIEDGLTSLNLISKTVQNTAGQFSVRVTEKSGSLYTKYISTYLRFLKDPRTGATTYGNLIRRRDIARRRFDYEVFNFLYIVTDSTMQNLEKAFLILNAQPTEAAFSDLYNSEKGSIENKEITITFNGFAVDGNYVNKIGSAFMNELYANTDYNSFNYDYSISNENINGISKLNGETLYLHENEGRWFDDKNKLTLPDGWDRGSQNTVGKRQTYSDKLKEKK